MKRDFRRDFEHLLGGLDGHLRLAQEMSSPNLEDDLCIRAAIVGFSFHSQTERWGRNHFDLVRSRRDKDYSNRNLSWYGPSAERHALLACLCLGFLLGLFQAEKISEEEFERGEAEIPPFLALHTDRVAP
jgi:hypothetical protein